MDSSVVQRISLGVLTASLLLGSWVPPHPLARVGAAGQVGKTRAAAHLSVLASGPPYWLPVPSMHSQRRYFAAAVGRDGRIYALGDDATVEVYVPATNSWYFVASMPQTRYMFAAAAGPDGRIYAIPGNSPEIVVGVIAYVPRQNRWVDVENTLDSHVLGAATTGPDGRIYALGGDAADILISTTEAYDTHTGQWSRVADLPTARGDLAAATGLDGRIYALGGAQAPSFGGAPVDTVEAYSVRTRRWVTLRALPKALKNLAAAGGPDGRIYALGGLDASDLTQRTVQAYEPRTNQWQPVAPLRTPRGYLAAVRGTDGRIYVLGGSEGGPADIVLASVEAYGPLISVSPPSVPVMGSLVLTGTNFAASATVTVTWGTLLGGRVLATGRTNRAGALLHPLGFHVPAGVVPGRYSVVAEDDRSRYPVTASLAVGVPASFGLAPTPLPLPTATATPSATTTSTGPQTRYVSPQGRNAPDCTRPAAPC